MIPSPRRFLSVLLFLFCRVLLLAGLAATVLVWRLSYAPLSTPFLAPLAAHFAERALPEWRVEIANVQIDLSDGAGGGVSLLGVELFAPSGARAAVAPKAHARMRLLGPKGALALTDISLLGGQFFLTRDQTGRLMFGDGASRPNEADSVAALVENLSRGGSGDEDFPLKRLEIKDTELTFNDVLTQREWSAANAHMSINPAEFGLMLAARADLVDETGDRWPLLIFAQQRESNHTMSVLARMRDVDPVVLAQTSRSLGLPLEALTRLRARAKGELRLELTPDEQLTRFDMSLTVGPGVVDLDQRRPLQGAELELSYTRATDDVVVNRALIMMDDLQVEASGAAQLTRGADGEVIRVDGRIAAPSATWGPDSAPLMRLREAGAVFSLDTERNWGTAQLTLAALEAQAAPRDDAAPPVGVDAANVTAALEGDLGGDRIVLKSATAEAIRTRGLDSAPPIADAVLSGAARRAASGGFITRASLSATAALVPLSVQIDGTVADGATQGSVRAAIPDLTVEQLLRLWPGGAAPNARKWMNERLIAARLQGLNIWISGETGENARVGASISARFEDAELIAHPELPPVTGLSGELRLTERSLQAETETAEIWVETSSGLQRLDAAGTTFRIPNLKIDPPSGEINLSVRGAIPAALTLLQGPPLRITERTRIDPASTSGSIAATGRITLPLLADAPKDLVRVEVDADLSNYALTVPGLDLPAAGPSAQVRITPSGLHVSGRGQLAGAPTTFNLQRSDGAGEPVLIHAETVANAALRARLRLPDIPALAIDPPVTARIDLRDDGATVFDATADLSSADMSLAPLGWRKPPGSTANLAVRGAALDDKSVQISSLVFAAANARIEASARINAAGEVVEVSVPVARLGAGSDLTAFYDGETLRVEGESLDLTAALERARDSDNSSGPSGAPQDCPQELRVSARINRVFLTEDTTLERVNGGAVAQPCGLLGLDIGFRVNGRAPARLRARRQTNGYGLEIDAPDAGALLRALDLYRGVRGGQLALRARARLDVAPPLIQGAIQVDNFVLTQAPMAARVLARGSLIGMLDELETGGLSFARLEAPFVGDGARWRFNEAAAYGPSLGIALEGSYDAKRKLVDLIGSVSPAYAINGALSHAPVLGDILTGGTGGGVFGVSFAVKGPTNTPQITVNPLASLAPGVFRRVIQTLMR